MSSIDITSGILTRPTKMLLYGVEGIGKTTLIALLVALGMKLLFLDTEAGTLRVDCKRVMVNTKAALDAVLGWLTKREGASAREFDTVVIDTVTGLESILEGEVLKAKQKQRMADFDYGKGSIYLREEFDRFLFNQLDELIAHGFNVILIAHAQVQRMQLPELIEGFDRYELAMDKKAAASIRQWCDHVLFANWDYRLTENERKETRGIAGKGRVLHAQHSAAWDAKNRAGLADKLEWKIEALAPLFQMSTLSEAEGDPKALWEQLLKVMAARRVDSSLLWSFLQSRFPKLEGYETTQLLPVDFLGRVISLDYVRRALAQPDKFAKTVLDHEPLPTVTT